jgi:transcriptional regulator with XRE-family HTH domain
MLTPMKLIRLEQEIPQQDLAERLRISEGHLSKIENNRREAPLRLKKRIARALGVPVEQIFPQVQPEQTGSASVLLGSSK